MNPAHDDPAHSTASEAATGNVVNYRGGESLAAPVDQPLPTDAEPILAGQSSLLVQIRRARFVSRAAERGRAGWRDPYRWASMSVALGAVLIVIAGLIEWLGG